MKKIYRLLSSFFPGAIKASLSWKWGMLKYLVKHSWITPRREGDFKMAEDFFLNYHALDEAARAEKLGRLTIGLDEESVNMVKLVLDRQRYVFTHDILALKSAYTAEERKMQSQYYRELGKVRRSCLDKDFHHFSSEAFIFLGGLPFFSESVQDRLRAGTIIDGGAYSGDSALSLCRHYSEATVFAFEPEPKNYERLIKNTASEARIVPVDLALGNGIRTELFLASDGASSRVASGGSSLKKVKTVALDAFVAERGILRVDGIKLDLEGFEQEALKGMADCLRQWRPCLAISIYHSASDFFTIKTMIEEQGLGYRFRIAKVNPFSLAQEVMLLAYPA